METDMYQAQSAQGTSNEAKQPTLARVPSNVGVRDYGGEVIADRSQTLLAVAL